MSSFSGCYWRPLEVVLGGELDRIWRIAPPQRDIMIIVNNYSNNKVLKDIYGSDEVSSMFLIFPVSLHVRT